MKKLLAGSLALGLAAAPAMAGSNVLINSLGGSPGSSFNMNGMQGYSWNFNEGLSGGYQGTLYDNIPTFLGGTSTGQQTFGAFGTIVGTYLFVDWVSATAQWSDDVQGMAPGSQITNVWYAYTNGSVTTPGISSTHIVKIYDMIPPGPVPGVSAVTANVGALLASIVLPAMPATGAQSVVASLSIPITIPNSGVWIKLAEVGDPNNGTFWMTGGRPGLGSTVDGNLFSLKDDGTGNPYNYFVGALAPTYGPPGSINFGAPGVGPYVMLNNVVGLNVIPAPASIGLLALGGLVSLRRRRR